MTPEPMTRLRCTMTINGETAFAEVPVNRELWRRASPEMREAFQDHARQALVRTIVDRYQPEVTVYEETTLSEGVEQALAEYDAQQDVLNDSPSARSSHG